MKSARAFKSISTFTNSIYRAADILLICCSFLIACSLYGVEFSNGYVLILTVSLCGYMYVAEAFKLYRSWRAGKLRHMVLTSWASFILAFALIIVFSFAFKFTESLSRVALSLWFIFVLLSLFLSRAVIHSYKKNRRRLGLSNRRVAIIGATEAGANLFEQVHMHDELGYDFCGFYEDRTPARTFEDLHLHVEGTINCAIEKAKAGSIDVLFIALPLKAEKRIADILVRLGDSTVDVHFIPDFLLSNLIHARIEHVGDVDTLSVFESPYFGAKEFIKRTEDIVVSLIILTLISPLLILIGLGIKFTSKGPVIFKQDRYGLGGEKIKVWKFRSMTVMENSDVVTQAKKGDTRITKFGAFLRKTSLDELPQFINVLTGQMSIVGPRPHAIAHNEEYRKKVDFYMLRHKVKPGITGWAQINGWRGETDTIDKMEKRVEFDLHYIKHWSLWWDLKIIVMTVFKGFVNKNAY